MDHIQTLLETAICLYTLPRNIDKYKIIVYNQT
jgi:hypothetical protein